MNIKKLEDLTKKSNRKYLLALIVLGVFLTGYITNQAQVNEEIIRSDSVKRESLVDSISASGEVEAQNSVVLNFSTPSKITWVGVKKGDEIKKWQTLASLDQRQLEKNLKKRLLAYMTNRWNFEQTQEDYEIEGRQLNEVTLTDAEKRILEKTQFSLDSSVLDVEVAELSKKEAYLYSPIAGTITAIEGIKTGTNLTALTAGSSYIKIVDLNSLHFVASIDETDYNKIFIGQKVEILLDAFPDETFIGHVSFISKEGKKMLSGGVTIPIEITFDEMPTDLALGLSGDAEFVVSEKENSLIIPKEFLKSLNGKDVVYVLEDNKPIAKEVEIGLNTISKVEIINGLNEGQEIVLTNNGK